MDIQPWAVSVSRGEGRTGAALLRAAQAGDPEALDRLLSPHARGLLLFCRGILGHDEDAEDAAQEALFRALRALPRFQQRQATLRTWLFRIALNICLDWKRDRRPTEPWDEEALAPAVGGPASPETIALRRLEIIEALGALPPERRAILLLKELEGWSAAEIGAMMGWNPKRVYNELYQARCTLIEWQAQVDEEGTE
jgi:RNA polymerase sigma-70 factor (ECF subfamily)